MEIRFAPGQRLDRMTAFVQRPFSGELAHATANGEKRLLPLGTDRATILHRRLPASTDAEALLLRRTQGQLGQIAFYRAERLPTQSPAGETFTLAPAGSFPKNELGDAFRMETPFRFQRPVTGVRKAVGAWRLKTPAFGGFQATMESPADARAYEGVRFSLVVEGLAGPTPVRIAVKEPVHSVRDWLVADAVLRPTGEGRQVFTLEMRGRPVVNLPPMRLAQPRRNRRAPLVYADAPGVPFGVRVTAASPVRWLMGEGGTSATFLTTDMTAALPAATEDQIEYMRQGFSTLMEIHAYGDPRIQKPLLWLARFAPERIEFQQMCRRAGLRSPFEGFGPPTTVKEPEPENRYGAPDWAVWQRTVMRRFIDLVQWRIESQQLYTGEFGSTWNDDTCNFEGWLGYAMCLDNDQGEFKASLRRFWDGLWTYSLDEGTGRYVTDNCHYSEEGGSSMGMRLLVDYGDPIAVERAMAAAGKLRHWLQKTDQGYLMKSGWAGPEGVWAGGRLGEPHPVRGHDWDLVVPADYVLWYSRHPQAVEYVTGLFAETGHDWRTTPPGGFFEFAAASLLEYDEFRSLCTRALLENKRPSRRSPDLVSWLSVAGVTPEIRAARKVKDFQPAAPLRPYVPLYPLGNQGTEGQWLEWRLTGDMRRLIDAYRRECEWMNNYGWLITEGYPAHDRIYEPRGALISSRMGARVSNRGSMGIMWPLYGLSYTKGARDLAALVTENLHDRLTARFYAFTDTPLEVEANVWRLHPGTYRVALSSDKDDNGEPDGVPMASNTRLLRGAPLSFTLPARQSAILSITPVNVRAPDYNKPDLAISLDTVDVVYNRHLCVKVHNLGMRPAENVLVRVRDAASGKVIPMGEQRIARIEAPLDFRPRYGFVQFDNIYAIARGVVVEIDPEGEIDDLNPFNNRLTLTDAHVLGPGRIGAERQAHR